MKRLIPKYQDGNIYLGVRSNKGLAFVGGHERTHDFLDFANELRGTPPLSIEGGSYYVPNVKNPIAKKYANEFMKTSYIHGRSPEETYANYVGFKAAKADGDFNKFNFTEERLKVPKTFVSEYEDYLLDPSLFE